MKHLVRIWQNLRFTNYELRFY